MIGGEFKGVWLDTCSSISVVAPDLKQESLSKLPSLPRPLFGPSATLIETSEIPTNLYVAGGSTDPNLKSTFIYKLDNNLE